MQKVARSSLRDAEYNPRVLADSERRKLRAGLKKHGMVAPITWNKRTGHVVGGHQRLAQLDALAGTANYALNVAVIDVDEMREKEINLLLNNPDAQGDWNMEKLADLLRLDKLDLAGAGFDEADVYRLFGDSITRQADRATINTLADQLKGIQETFTKMAGEAAGDEYYLVVIFRDQEHCDKFIELAKLPENRYQSGTDLMRLCGFTEG
jgi:ParB-like chromosome segregation protein Spo0J